MSRQFDATARDVAPLPAFNFGNVPIRRAPAANGGASAGLGEVDGAGVSARAPELLARAGASPGSPLPEGVRGRFERSLGADLGGVRVHAGDASAQAARSVSARAYTVGSDIHFGAGALRPGTVDGDRLLAHEVAHTVQRSPSEGDAKVSSPGDPAEREAEHAAGAMTAGIPALMGSSAPGRAGVSRGEVAPGTTLGPGDWTSADRIQNTEVWRKACLYNLKQGDNTQYQRIEERRDFYKWFAEHTASLGYDTRWALAASLVASGAHQVAYMGETATKFAPVNNELKGIMREGNQVIFDNVFPKLKKLLEGGPVKGAAALAWDSQVLSEEQTLIQPMYSRVSQETRDNLANVAKQGGLRVPVGAFFTGGGKVKEGPVNKAGDMPSFPKSEDINQPQNRWRYGMRLGKQFSKTDTGYEEGVTAMPTPGSSYTSGAELAKVSTRANLHQLDVQVFQPSNADLRDVIAGILARFSDVEKAEFARDMNPDGIRYSEVIGGQWLWVSEAPILNALPSSGPARNAFLTRFRAAQATLRATLSAPTPMMPM